MALKDDWDDLMADVEWEESEIDSGYFDSDNEAGNPTSWWKAFIRGIKNWLLFVSICLLVFA